MCVSHDSRVSRMPPRVAGPARDAEARKEREKRRRKMLLDQQKNFRSVEERRRQDLLLQRLAGISRQERAARAASPDLSRVSFLTPQEQCNMHGDIYAHMHMQGNCNRVT